MKIRKSPLICRDLSESVGTIIIKRLVLQRDGRKHTRADAKENVPQTKVLCKRTNSHVPSDQFGLMM